MNEQCCVQKKTKAVAMDTPMDLEIWRLIVIHTPPVT